MFAVDRVVNKCYDAEMHIYQCTVGSTFYNIKSEYETFQKNVAFIDEAVIKADKFAAGMPVVSRTKPALLDLY